MDIDPRQEWATPDDFWQVINTEFDFQLDACARADNAKCENYITPEIDALSPLVNWIDEQTRCVWVNPGFSNMTPWVTKAYDEAQKYPDAVVVVMGLPSFSAKWWRELVLPKASEIRLLSSKQRVQFVAPPGIKQTTNNRNNCIFVFRKKRRQTDAHVWNWDWMAEMAEVGV